MPFNSGIWKAMYEFVHAIWLENALGEITTNGYGY
jgi:hypothetical protein